MSEVRGTRLTYAGLTLLAKCQTGQELHFPRVAMGDGTVADDQDIRQLTGLVSPKMNLPIKSVKVSGVGTTIMETQLKNVNLATGFFAREVGIFAMDGETEILYAIRNTGADSEYIPAGGGSEVWDLIYDVVTVVDQATNITANLDGGIAYVPRLDFNAHIEDDTNPHPNWLQIKPATITPTHFWTQEGADGQLHSTTLDDARTGILGDNANTIPALSGRVDQLEREQANIMWALEAKEIFPDYNARLIEDFTSPEGVDLFSCIVTSIVAGSNDIDVETLRGIVPGAWYTISDGVDQEQVQVRSVAKSGTTYRVILAANIQHDYVSGQTTMYRTTAQIESSAGVAEGSGDQKSMLWLPTTVWTGAAANMPVIAELDTSLSNEAAFTTTNSIEFTVDGAVTLKPSTITGIALIIPGGGSGTWSNYVGAAE